MAKSFGPLNLLPLYLSTSVLNFGFSVLLFLMEDIFLSLTWQRIISPKALNASPFEPLLDLVGLGAYPVDPLG